MTMRDRIENLWQMVHRNVAERGWSLMAVHPDQDTPGFTYSLGAWDLALPELIVFGLPASMAGPILNRMLDAAKAGLVLKEGVSYSEFSNLPLQLKALIPEQTREHMKLAWTYHAKGRPAPPIEVPFLAFQVVYPDPRGLFPWEEGYQFPMQELLWLPEKG
jgi:hypothetical protein